MNMRSHEHDHTHTHNPYYCRHDAPPLVPVTVLTGYLGSGKSTLLNHILNDETHGMRFAIIENELGAVTVDDKILSENVDDEIIEVMNGCICCSVRGDLVKALKNLYKRVQSFDGIIIETTGLADPAPVVQTFFIHEEISRMYTIDSVITVADAKYIIERLDEEKEEGCVNEAVQQVVFADKIIINKVDLVPEEDDLKRIEKRLKTLNPGVRILRTKYSKVPPKELLNIQAFELDRVLGFNPTFLEGDQEPDHDMAVYPVACKIEGELNAEMMTNWIQRLVHVDGANLYRYKGVIAVKGKEEKFVFQGVGMLCNATYQGKWKRGEKRESRFVFIGKELDRELLKAGFAACKVTEELRFPIGARVEANCGTFRRGKIVKHWDDGNAYRIELEDGHEVWAPVDVDVYVRAA